jgi:hypothetical protein
MYCVGTAILFILYILLARANDNALLKSLEAKEQKLKEE